MNWLKLKIRNWIIYDNEVEECVVSSRKQRGLVMSTRDDLLNCEPLRLSIYRADGGTIVETSTYDRQKDRHQNQLHIIGHGQDLGEGLSKIITIESLRG
jgi:hypothetical protein